MEQAMPVDEPRPCAAPRHIAAINTEPQSSACLGSGFPSAGVSSNPKRLDYSVRRAHSFVGRDGRLESVTAAR